MNAILEEAARKRAEMLMSNKKPVADRPTPGFSGADSILRNSSDRLHMPGRMMYAHAGKVGLNELRKRELSSDEDFEMSGPEGMGGKNPLRYASVELGRKIVERMGDLIGAKAMGML